MACLVKCLGKPGSTYNIVIDGVTVYFKGGSTQVLDESVGVVLTNIKDTDGNNVFDVKLDNKTVEETYVPILEKPKKKEPKTKKPTTKTKQRPLV